MWLYRGHTARYLGLVRDYLGQLRQECALIPQALAPAEASLARLLEIVGHYRDGLAETSLAAPGVVALRTALAEWTETQHAYAQDRAQLVADLSAYAQTWATPPPAAVARPVVAAGPAAGGQGDLFAAPAPAAATAPELAALNAWQQQARLAFEPLAGRCKDLGKQLDLLAKLAARTLELTQSPDLPVKANASWDTRALTKTRKNLEDERHAAAEQLHLATYYYRQAVWLHTRFPDAALVPVPGLVRVVDHADLEAADWSLTPGRYVGVAPAEADEDFDFEAELRDLHLELAGLNEEASELARVIQTNFEELV